MRRAIIIIIAVCCVFLVPALLLRHERARQLKLKAESAALRNHLQQEVASVMTTDPLYAEAERRNDANNDAMQNARSKGGEDWLQAHLKDLDEQKKYQEMDATHTLLGAIQMLRDDSDRKLLHQFVLDTPRSVLPQSEREDIGRIPQRELATIRQALTRYLPNSELSSLDDPSRLWDILIARASEIEPRVEADAARLNKECDRWPPMVLRESTFVPEVYLKNRVYTYYIRNSLPLDYSQTLQHRASIEQAIHGKS